MSRSFLFACAFLISSGSAFALTVENKSEKEIAVGLDAGNQERVEKIGAGKSASIPEFCAKDGCGVSGPWGYSILTRPGDTITYNKSGAKLSSANGSEERSEGTRQR